MNSSLVKILIRFRSVIVAFLNALITWVILIIAPLGLFTVIICTIAVFLSSVIFAFIGDFFLFIMLKQGGFNGIKGMRENQRFVDSQLPSVNPPESIRRRNDDYF
ncbi:MAG: hypothetical protein IGQ45_05320 [Cyanobacterium sp. T60_A2020_053]|nr:hypothetical protein [Cyanobacterium sp. T60_A2020_053]